VDKILSHTQDLSHNNNAVAFITIDQHLASVGAHIKTDQGSAGIGAAIKLATVQFSNISNNPLSKMTVDAAEAALITAFQPKWNVELKDFTQMERPTLMKKLKEDGYTHLHIHIDLKDAPAKVRGPMNGIASSHHSWTFNLDTGDIESSGSGSWQPPITHH
jgi:hypothetical protein